MTIPELHALLLGYQASTPEVQRRMRLLVPGLEELEGVLPARARRPCYTGQLRIVEGEPHIIEDEIFDPA